MSKKGGGKCHSVEQTPHTVLTVVREAVCAEGRMNVEPRVNSSHLSDLRHATLISLGVRFFSHKMGMMETFFTDYCEDSG